MIIELSFITRIYSTGRRIVTSLYSENQVCLPHLCVKLQKFNSLPAIRFFLLIFDTFPLSPYAKISLLLQTIRNSLPRYICKIDPCFCVKRTDLSPAVKGAALDHYLPGFLFREVAINHIKCSLRSAHSIVKKSEKPVISNTSLTSSETFISFSPAFCVKAFCVLRMTRSPAEEIYSSFSMSSTSDSTVGRIAEISASNSGAVTVSNLPTRARVSVFFFSILRLIIDTSPSYLIINK